MERRESSSSGRKKATEQSVFSPGPFLSGYSKKADSHAASESAANEPPLSRRVIQLLNERGEPMTLLEMTSALKMDAEHLRPALLKLVDAEMVVIDSVRNRELFSLA